MSDKKREIVLHQASDDKSYLKKNALDLIIYILVITISLSVMKFFELFLQRFSKDKQKKYILLYIATALVLLFFIVYISNIELNF